MEPVADRRIDDRRAAARGTPERRKRGRPLVPLEQRPATLHVKVSAALHDAVCAAAVRQGLAVNALLRSLIEKAIPATK
jgi:predicted HicB family RNase H-like nuclease